MDSQFKVQKIGILILLFLSCFTYGQETNPQTKKEGIRVLFYNVENLFHPSDDPVKRDEEFTPEGVRHWSYKRYHEKLANISKTVIAIGEWEPPAIIGLCEVENLQCLQDLVKSSPLKKWNYEIVHEESADRRGIDVAFLYRKEYFTEISHEAIRLIFPEKTSPTRDILYLKGKTGDDTLHLFVNHWPSRYGGQLETEGKRNFAAKVLRNTIDSLREDNKNVKILALGDFNDHPHNVSMNLILGAKKVAKDIKENELINMIWQYEDEGIGTHKFRHEWGVLDQFIVNAALLKDTLNIHTTMSAAKIFMPDFLIEAETDGIGKKPYRTYHGFKYHGGYSDHFPIYVDLYY